MRRSLLVFPLLGALLAPTATHAFGARDGVREARLRGTAPSPRLPQQRRFGLRTLSRLRARVATRRQRAGRLHSPYGHLASAPSLAGALRSPGTFERRQGYEAIGEVTMNQSGDFRTYQQQSVHSGGDLDGAFERSATIIEGKSMLQIVQKLEPDGRVTETRTLFEGSVARPASKSLSVRYRAGGRSYLKTTHTLPDSETVRTVETNEQGGELRLVHSVNRQGSTTFMERQDDEGGTYLLNENSETGFSNLRYVAPNQLQPAERALHGKETVEHRDAVGGTVRQTTRHTVGRNGAREYLETTTEREFLPGRLVRPTYQRDEVSEGSSGFAPGRSQIFRLSTDHTGEQDGRKISFSSGTMLISHPGGAGSFRQPGVYRAIPVSAWRATGTNPFPPGVTIERINGAPHYVDQHPVRGLNLEIGH